MSYPDFTQNNNQMMMQDSNKNPYHSEHIEEFCAYTDAAVNEQAAALWERTDFLQQQINKIHNAPQAVQSTLVPHVDEKALKSLKQRIISMFR